MRWISNYCYNKEDCKSKSSIIMLDKLRGLEYSVCKECAKNYKKEVYIAIGNRIDIDMLIKNGIEKLKENK